MIWITLLSIVVSLLVIWKNIQPVWIQLLAFTLSASLFMTSVFRDFSHHAWKSWFQKRSLLILLLLSLATINFLARKYDPVLDLSKNKAYTLRPETIGWIKKIKDPTEMLVFLRRDDKTSAYASWLQEQINQTGQPLQIRVKNINQEVALTQKYDVKQTGEVILVSGSQWIKIPSFREKDLIQGISRLVSKTSSSLCFLSGHGEADLEDLSPEGLSQLKDFLTGLGYRLLTISFETHTLETIQLQCGLVAVINPKVNFLADEISLFKNLLKSPIPLLLTVENTFSPNIKPQLAEEGIEITPETLINQDNLKNKKPLTDILLNSFGTDMVFENLNAGLYFPQSKTLLVKKTKSSKFQWDTFLTTSPAQTGFQLLEKPDQSGPFILGVRDPQQSKIILSVGRSFLSGSVGYADNEKFFFNLIKSLLQEPLVQLADTFEKSEKNLALSPKEIFWVKNMCFYILPGALTVLCLIIWWRRS